MSTGHFHAIAVASRHRSARLCVWGSNVEEDSGTLVSHVGLFVHWAVIKILPGERKDAALSQLREAILQRIQLTIITFHYRCAIFRCTHCLVTQCFQCMYLLRIGLRIFLIAFRNVLECRQYKRKREWEKKRADERMVYCLFVLQLYR